LHSAKMPTFRTHNTNYSHPVTRYTDGLTIIIVDYRVPSAGGT